MNFLANEFEFMAALFRPSFFARARVCGNRREKPVFRLGE
jgi:hypothetical protein